MVFGRETRRRLFARYYDRVIRSHERHVGERKRALLGSLRGTVLELGPGTGGSFPYLPPGVRWIGLEPNPYMHPFLRERAGEYGIEADVRPLGGEEMDVEDASVDAVLCTLVLCSVDDQERVLEEVRRVLRPGGRFAFLEHVAAPGPGLQRCCQRLLRPAWRYLADGCVLDRDTEAAIRRAGFASVDLERFRLPAKVGWIVAPHIIGTATR